MTALHRIEFRQREEPLNPVAVCAMGATVPALATRLLELSDDVLAKFSGVATDGAVIVLGPSEALPWVDGALYLGASGALLWPTWSEPSVHPLLLERALRRQFVELAAGPLALLFREFTEAPRVVPLSNARPLSRERLAALQ